MEMWITVKSGKAIAHLRMWKKSRASVDSTRKPWNKTLEFGTFQWRYFEFLTESSSFQNRFSMIEHSCKQFRWLLILICMHSMITWKQPSPLPKHAIHHRLFSLFYDCTTFKNIKIPNSTYMGKNRDFNTTAQARLQSLKILWSMRSLARGYVGVGEWWVPHVNVTPLTPLYALPLILFAQDGGTLSIIELINTNLVANRCANWAIQSKPHVLKFEISDAANRKVAPASELLYQISSGQISDIKNYQTITNEDLASLLRNLGITISCPICCLMRLLLLCIDRDH